MTTLTYNTSRKQAADRLDVSTRTIDRYVKSGKLSYKKVANKVILAAEEVSELEDEYQLLKQEPQSSEVTRERAIPMEKVKSSLSTGKQESSSSVKEFAAILGQKDQVIEEKNQLIFALQRKLGELETAMKQMVALPDHSQEKEALASEIKELELAKTELESQVKREKMWNVVYIGLVLVAAVMILFFTLIA